MTEPACPICKGAGFVRRDVPFDHPDFGKATPCVCVLRPLETRRRERGAALGLASLPVAAAGQTFATFDPRRNPRAATLCRAAGDWASGEGKPWLFLSGSSGTGKTHASYAATHALIARGESVIWTCVPDLLDTFRSVLGARREWEELPYDARPDVAPPRFDEMFADVLAADWLVLDDLGAQSDRPWVTERLYLLIDGRYRSRRPLLVTTNCRPGEIEPRIRSRLLDAELCRVVDTGDEDQRPRRSPAAGTEGGR